MRVSTEVGNRLDAVANVSSCAFFEPSRAELINSLMAANRSVMGISPVGTNMRTNVNAFPPESSLRVLMAMLVRSDSTGMPSLRW